MRTTRRLRRRGLGWRAGPLTAELALFHLTHHYTAYWQARRDGMAGACPGRLPACSPREGVVRLPAAELSGSPAPSFAVIHTDYHVGVGTQWGVAPTSSTPWDSRPIEPHRSTSTETPTCSTRWECEALPTGSRPAKPIAAQ